jgi:hypothetical protein
VTSLALLELDSEKAAAGCEFFWHIGWSGLASGEVVIDEDKTKLKFDSFKPVLKRLGSYREVATWHQAHGT